MHGQLSVDLAHVQVDAIKPIYDEREYEENQQKNSNVLSYRRSMSVSLSSENPRRER